MIPKCFHQHSRFCTTCDNDATTHLHVGGWCGNMCAEHGKELKQQRGTTAELTVEVYIADDNLKEDNRE